MRLTDVNMVCGLHRMGPDEGPAMGRAKVFESQHAAMQAEGCMGGEAVGSVWQQFSVLGLDVPMWASPQGLTRAVLLGYDAAVPSTTTAWNGAVVASWHVTWYGGSVAYGFVVMEAVEQKGEGSGALGC